MHIPSEETKGMKTAAVVINTTVCYTQKSGIQHCCIPLIVHAVDDILDSSSAETMTVKIHHCKVTVAPLERAAGPSRFDGKEAPTRYPKQ